MSRRKCSFFNCNNMQKNTKTRFHTFPSDINLLKKWIIHSGNNFILQTLGNVELDSISPKKMKNRFLCSKHFNRDQYSNPVDPKSRLNSNAVPKNYTEG
ncbi:THAP-type domain-containing protein, partial [Aphis craccivora]